MKTQVTPPPVEVITRSLRVIVATGLPISPDLSDDVLLGLRGVVARSIDPDSRLGRVKALDELVGRVLVHYPDDALGESARILFALAPGFRGANLTARRQAAAQAADREFDHFRKRIEPEILKAVAWQLHRDSQNYIPRGRATPPPLEASGDTPTIRTGDLANKEAAEHGELLSRLWAHVYALRAEILRVERLKSWPHDPTEPSTSERVLEEAITARDYEVDAVKVLIANYTERFGQRITHGDSEFNAEALLRLAGWQSGLDS
jgi:hypothetical protein